MMSGRNIQHYIFGYGSLICSTSRSKTTSTIVGKTVLPVQVEGLQTIWSVRAETAGWTPLGVAFQPTARAFGVLLSVDAQELELFDQRELGYARTELGLDKIRPIPFLDQNCYVDHQEHHVIRAMDVTATSSRTTLDTPPVKIWVYVPEMFKPSNAEFPIPQSYLDVILRGCLELSPRLAEEFLKQTHVVGDSPGFVDDRKRHLYPRGDYEWSLQNANLVDRLIEEHRPDLMAIRRELS
jgi:hypothetical protein